MVHWLLQSDIQARLMNLMSDVHSMCYFYCVRGTPHCLKFIQWERCNVPGSNPIRDITFFRDKMHIYVFATGAQLTEISLISLDLVLTYILWGPGIKFHLGIAFFGDKIYNSNKLKKNLFSPHIKMNIIFLQWLVVGFFSSYSFFDRWNIFDDNSHCYIHVRKFKEKS